MIAMLDDPTDDLFPPVDPRRHEAFNAATEEVARHISTCVTCQRTTTKYCDEARRLKSYALDVWRQWPKVPR